MTLRLIMTNIEKDPIQKAEYFISKNYTSLEKQFKKFCIIAALTETHGNKLKAALILGINRNTFAKYVKDYNIQYRRSYGTVKCD